MKNLPQALAALALLAAMIMTGMQIRTELARRALETQLGAANQRASDAEGQLAAARELSEGFQKRVTALDADLGATKSKLTTTETRNTQLDHDLAQTKAQLAERDQSLHILIQQIGALQRDLGEARSNTASPEAVAAYRSTISELERQLADARGGSAITAGAGASTAAFSMRRRAPSEFNVISVGPQSAFVVLNFGRARGAHAEQSLAIQRGTETLATVLISDVRENFSIAQVQPDSLRGALQKGDFAVTTP